MQFKTIMGLFALAGLGAAMPADDNVGRSPKESFCCSGIVVSGIVGLGCEPQPPYEQNCPYGRKTLTCEDGAIVFPPNGDNSYVVCGK